MADQPARLEAATVKAEIGAGIVYRFSNDAVGAPVIPTLSGDIPNLKQVILQIQTDGANKISFATKIYATTAAGIAATVDQEIFLVQSSDADEIYAVWQNVGGTAVDTGKRSLSATAVIEATEAATAAAASAQQSADAATIKVARFLLPSATNPVLRDDGQALQIGDRYFNTTDQFEYIYKNDGWEANNLDGQALAQPSGAGQVGAIQESAGSGTVQDALNSLYSRDKIITTLSASTFAALNVPSSIKLISTSYAISAGYGGRSFRRYTGPYAADGFCIIQTADGAKWKAEGVPDPQLFGAVPGTDITAAMQRWATYAATRAEPEMDWSIKGTISSPVSATVATSSVDYCQKITGKILLKEPTVIVAGALISLNNFIQTTGADGEYLGSILFSARKVYDAFVFKGCKYLDAGDYYVVGCIRHGIQALDYTTEYKFKHIKTLYNGSSKFQGVAFSAPTHFRTGSGTGQRSNFQGFTPPPGVRAGDGLMINGYFYHIRVIDTVGKTMQVYPALDPVDLANIAGAYWCFGGGFRHADGETNAGYIARYSGLVNAVGITCDDLYPVTIGKAVSQLESVQVRVGVDRDSAYRGGSIMDTYTENTGIACVILAQGGDNPYGIGHVGQFTPDKSYQFLDYINDDLSKNVLRNTPVVITDFNRRSIVPRASQSPEITTIGGNTGVTVVCIQEVAGGFGKTIKLLADPVMMAAHGTYSLSFYVYGASTGNPGTISLIGDTGILVMSESTHNVALTAPTQMFAMFSNGNWTVHKSAPFSNA